MTLIDFILNIAALLLLLNWRAVSLDPLAKSPPATLIATLRRAEPARQRGWYFLAALAALILIRALAYWQLGPAINWTPNLRLGPIAPSFRSDFFGMMLIYSILSFAMILIVFYVWLLFFSVVNTRISEPNSLQRWAVLHLGAIDRLPRL